MNSFVIFLSCLAVVTTAIPTQDQDVVIEFLANGEMRCRTNCNRNRINPWNDCPPTNCPPPLRPQNCGVVDCTLPQNRQPDAIFDHPTDPNKYIMCSPLDAVVWAPKDLWCACGTVFSSRSNPLRCVHPWEWLNVCPNHPARWEDIVLSTENCGVDCPDCNGDTTRDDDEEPVPTTTIRTPGNCQCPCVPCVWWPCMPCPQTCPCGNNNNNRNPQQPPQRPNNPWEDQPPRWPNDQWDEQLPRRPNDPWDQTPPRRPNDPWDQTPPRRPNDPWDQTPPRRPNDPWDQTPPRRPNNPWDNQPW